MERTSTALVTRWTVDCGSSGVAGGDVRVDGLESSNVDVLVGYAPLGHDTIYSVLRPGKSSMTLPASPSLRDTLERYLTLGIRHIAGGLDHLLFLIALIVLVRVPSQLAWTITGFTLGHSATLALVALGITRAPIATEALIAVSILFVAREILASENGTPTLTRRYPWLIAVPFGLIHGLGFAGALAQIGLPAGSTLPALAAFNVGIEVGQLAAGAVVLGFLILARRSVSSVWAGNGRHIAYAIGIVAAYWSVERIYQVVSTS